MFELDQAMLFQAANVKERLFSEENPEEFLKIRDLIRCTFEFNYHSNLGQELNTYTLKQDMFMEITKTYLIRNKV